jgi:surface carbohydrate biosynthesis protein
MRIVLIDIEIINREFDGKLLLGTYLVSKGYSVIIGTKRGIRKASRKYTNCLYITKSVSPALIKYYKYLNKRKIKIISLDVEGGVLGNQEIEALKMRYQPEVFPYLSKILLYGNKQLDLFKQNIMGFDLSDVHIVGDPRFELLKQDYREFYNEQISQNLKKFGNFILINTSFTLANHKKGDSHLFNYFWKSKDISDEMRPMYIEKIKYYKEIIQSYIQMINNIADSMPNITFVLRPHPGEKIETYIQNIKKKNVKIIHEGNVHAWILASKLIIHFDCTTGIEGLLAGKPIISYKTPRYKSLYTSWLPVSISQEANNLGELIELVDKNINSKSAINNEEKLDLASQYFCNFKIDSLKTCRNVLDELKVESLIDKEPFNFMEFAKNTLRKRFIHKKEVKERTTVLNNILSTDVKVRFINKDSFMLYR